MKKLSIFDPPMCCYTGVCGVDPDAELVEFAADIAWLQKNGVEVQRYNIAQEPGAFIEDPVVKAEINESGESCLPLLVLEGQVISRGIYPQRKQLQSWMGIDSLEQSADTGLTAEGPSSCGCASGSCDS